MPSHGRGVIQAAQYLILANYNNSRIKRVALRDGQPEAALRPEQNLLLRLFLPPPLAPGPFS